MFKDKIYFYFFISIASIIILFPSNSYPITETSNEYYNQAIPRNRIIIKAAEFEFDGNKNIIFAKGGVKVYETNLYLSGREAVYDQNKNTAQITGDINLNYRDFKVKCQKVTLYGYGDRRIEASNGIVFSYKNINGRSNSAVFYPKERKMVLNGKAVAASKNNQLSGEEIIIFVDQRKIISRGNSIVTISKTK